MAVTLQRAARLVDIASPSTKSKLKVIIKDSAPKIQAAISRTLADSDVSLWQRAFSSQCLKYLGCLPPPSHLTTVSIIMKKLAPRLRYGIFKTLMFTWTTSHRMTNKLEMKCRLGCVDGFDSLLHYRECRPLWSAVLDALTLDLPPAKVALYEQLRLVDLPRERWGISVDGTLSNFKSEHGWVLATAAATYQQLTHHLPLTPVAAARSAVAQLRNRTRGC